MRLTAILAMDQNGVIGKDNALPWHLSTDLKRFRKLSMGRPIVMGRKTHESIGRALPGRQNIVISRQAGYQAPGCEVAGSLREALELVNQDSPDGEVMLIGGAQLLASALQDCSRFLLTWVDAKVEGDVTFPPPDFRDWQPVAEEYVSADEKNQYSHYFFDLRRPESPNLRDWRPPWARS